MWLALAARNPVTVRAEAGSLWAEATVTLASTTWNMGNGDTIECAGAGTPIVDTDTPTRDRAATPTVRRHPMTNRSRLRVTATWAVTYRSSAGSGSAGTLDRTPSVAYDVDEIQTLGVSN